MSAQSPVRALRFATASYVLGWMAHVSFVFYLAPLALRLGDAGGRDAWVFAGTAVASVLAVLPSGRLADRFPRRHILRASMLLLGASYLPLLLLPPSFAATLAATLITGTGFAMMFVSFNAYVPDLVAGTPLSGAYAKSSAFSTLAGAAGPFVAALVFDLIQAQPFALRVNAALFLLIALAGAACTLALPAAGHGARDTVTRGGLVESWRSERASVVPLTIVMGFLGAGYGATLPYFAVFFLDHVQLGAAPWGYTLAAATFASAAGTLLAGRLASRFPIRPFILAPQVALAFVSLSFIAPLPALALGAAFVVRNAFSSTTGPLVNSVLMPRVAPHARGRVQAWGTLAWNVGWAGGAAIGGLALARWGGAVFPIGAVFGLLGVAAGVRLIQTDGSPAPAMMRER